MVIGFLAAGVASYLFFSQDKAPAPSEDGSPRTFAAPRAKAKAPQEDAKKAKEPGDDKKAGKDGDNGEQESGPPDVVVDALFEILKGVREGNTDEPQRAEHTADLVAALEAAGMGTDINRTVAAEDTVWAIVRADAGRPFKGIKDDLLWRLAEGFARDLDIRLNQVEEKVAALSKLPAFEAPSGSLAMPWEVLKGFDFEQGAPLPDDVTAFEGKRVAINGYMVPLTEEERPTEFLLVSTLWDCCYGQAPKVNHGIVVTMKPKGAPYSDFPIIVVGTMEIGEELEDGEVISLFRMKATRVIEQDI